MFHSLDLQTLSKGFPCQEKTEESVCSVRDPGLISGLERSPEEGLSTPVFLPEEFHGQRNVAGYSPWGQRGQPLLSD